MEKMNSMSSRTLLLSDTQYTWKCTVYCRGTQRKFDTDEEGLRVTLCSV